MNTDNGGLACGRCLGPLEYRFRRARIRKYTSEEGPAEETTSVTVGRCSREGRYKTIYPHDVVRNKHYSLSEIQSVLDGRNDYSLASERTMYYWKSWFKNMFEAVVDYLWQVVNHIISQETIFSALQSFLEKLAGEWLRYILDLFSAGINNLCMFFDLLTITIISECGNLCRTHRNGSTETDERGCIPLPGG